MYRFPLISLILCVLMHSPPVLYAQHGQGRAEAMRERQEQLKKKDQDSFEVFDQHYTYCQWNRGDSDQAIFDVWGKNLRKFIELCFHPEFIYFWFAVSPGKAEAKDLVSFLIARESELLDLGVALEFVETRRSRGGDPVGTSQVVKANDVSLIKNVEALSGKVKYSLSYNLESHILYEH